MVLLQETLIYRDILISQLYDQMIAEGIELPAERPGKDIVMCLLELNAPRLAGLEVKAKPRVISTLLDLINCIGENEDVELSPELQELVEMADPKVFR